MVEETARELAEILWAEGLTEISMETGEESLRLRRRRIAAPAPLMVAPEPLPSAPPSGRFEEDSVEESLEELAAVPVSSTFVGVVHLTDHRGESLVSAGQKVKAGHVLALIETMGLNHEVHAPHDALIFEILIQDGEPVEYGQALLILQSIA